ncbi:MAG: class I SAM-dependent methyltransferase [Fimbriimonadaceae bacterium]|nr:class I SAM-dependent methyltransferase [Fimbriimonadaceae bacterium]
MAVDDSWAAGQSYENFMGRWSRRLAREYVSWLGMPAGLDWLDVGCGTGALAEAVADLAAPASVVGCDPSGPFVHHAQESTRDSRLSFITAGVDDLPIHPDGFGCVASLLAMNFMPDSGDAVRRMASVAAPGATVSACVWDYGEGMLFLRHFWDAAAAQAPSAAVLDEGARFPICRPDVLVNLFRGGGLADVHCAPLEIQTEFRNFQDYWHPFLACTGPAPSYVASLSAGRRADLAREIEARLSPESDGKIVLDARAWAVRGVTERSREEFQPEA